MLAIRCAVMQFVAASKIATGNAQVVPHGAVFIAQSKLLRSNTGFRIEVRNRTHVVYMKSYTNSNLFA